MISPTKKVVGATVVGMAMVLFAMVSSAPTATPSAATEPALLVVAAPNREALAERDEDGNGIPDWKDALQAVDRPRLATTSSSTYERPTTLTGEFGLQFFEQLMTSEMLAPEGLDEERLIEAAVTQLSDRVAIKPLDSDSVTKLGVVVQTDRHVIEYLNSVATVLNAYPGGSENELDIVNRAVSTGNPADLAPLAALRTSYGAMLEDLKAIPAPRATEELHYQLLASVTAVYEDLVGMEQVFADPLLALLHIKRHPDDALGLFYTLVALRDALLDHESALTDTDAARYFEKFKLAPQ